MNTRESNGQLEQRLRKDARRRVDEIATRIGILLFWQRAFAIALAHEARQQLAIAEAQFLAGQALYEKERAKRTQSAMRAYLERDDSFCVKEKIIEQ